MEGGKLQNDALVKLPEIKISLFLHKLIKAIPSLQII